jgi:hypothetical protein
VRIIAPVKYDDEDMPYDYPHRQGDVWDIRVNIDNGQIEDWPNGVAPLELYMKVTDAGQYFVLRDDGRILWSVADYVPSFIPNNYGDYLTFQIDTDGKIINWTKECTREAVMEVVT